MDFVCTPLTAKTIMRTLHHVPCSVAQFSVSTQNTTEVKRRVKDRKHKRVPGCSARSGEPSWTYCNENAWKSQVLVTMT